LPHIGQRTNIASIPKTKNGSKDSQENLGDAASLKRINEQKAAE
jgi:hypothetical protein